MRLHLLALHNETSCIPKPALASVSMGLEARVEIATRATRGQQPVSPKASKRSTFKARLLLRLSGY